MNYRREAEREAFRAVEETCPEVDDAMAEATKRIKAQTGALRDALVDAIQRALEAEDRITDLERRVQDLEHELDEMRAAA